MSVSPNISYLPNKDRKNNAVKKRLAFKPGKKIPTLIVIFLLLYLLISFFTHFQKLYVLQKDISAIELEVQDLKAKNEELKQQLKQAQSDAYIEETAREKLGLVKPGETRIVPVPKNDGKEN